MRSVPAVVAAAFGAAAAVVSLIGPSTFFVEDLAFGRSEWAALFDSRPVAAVVGALVAVVAAVVVRHTVAAIIGAGIGAIVLLVLALSEMSGKGADYPSAVAAGLILGCLTVATRPTASGGVGRAGWIGLAVGVGAGFLLARSDPFTYQDLSSQNHRYADYLPHGFVLTHGEGSPLVVLCAAIALIALAVFAAAARRATSDEVERPQVAVVIVGAGVPVTTFLVYAWMRASTPAFGEIDVPGWVFTAVLAAVALATALTLPGRMGLVWVGVVALVAATAPMGDIGSGWISTVITIALLALGAALGTRRRSALPVGIAVLVVGVLLQGLRGGTSELVAIVGILFVLPPALGYAMSVCTPEQSGRTPAVHPAIVAAALATAVPLSIPSAGTAFGWTAYTPLTDSLSGAGYLDIGSTDTSSITTSALILVATGVIAWLITRRERIGGGDLTQ